MSLLNTLPYSSVERRELFLLLLRYAAATSQLPLLYPFINELPKHLETWGATPEQRCALHSTVAEVLREAGEACVAPTSTPFLARALISLSRMRLCGSVGGLSAPARARS